MSTKNTSQLFASAEEAGDLSSDSVSLLSPLGQQIGRALSTVQTIKSDRITLVTVLLDNSPSMDYVNPDGTLNPKGLSNRDVVLEGHDLIWTALANAKTADSIQAFSAFINEYGGNHAIHFNFRPLAGWDPMTKSAYRLIGGTPLYDAVLRTLGAVAAETQKYLDQSIEVASATLILTDGADNASVHSPGDVAKVVKDLLAQERHRIYLGGVTLDGVNFNQIGKEMGLAADCIRNIPSDPKEIRAFLNLFSQSAIAVSQAADLSTMSSVGLGS